MTPKLERFPAIESAGASLFLVKQNERAVYLVHHACSDGAQNRRQRLKLVTHSVFFLMPQGRPSKFMITLPTEQQPMQRKALQVSTKFVTHF